MGKEMVKFFLMIWFLVFIGTSCNKSQENKTGYRVEYKGALKNMMHQGDISAKVDLKELKDWKHLYAIGAVESLKGEIQIFDSEPYHTSVINNKLMFDHSFSKKATLLVYASVDKWNAFDIPDMVANYEQLEAFIQKTAKENKIDVNQPFPFLMEGKIQSFDWHVIDWKDGDLEHTHEKHKTSGLSGSIKNRNVEMIGFYSNAHHTIFTHHNTNMHMHGRTIDKKVAGHVDDLTLGKGMVLKLPM